MGSGKSGRWRISFHFRQPRRQRTPPEEFLCPISCSLMADPVILPSGQSFERRCIESLLALSQEHASPFPPNNPFFFTTAPPLIPNIALKTAIGNWCSDSGLSPPDPPDAQTADGLVLKSIAANSSSCSSSSTLLAKECDPEANASPSESSLPTSQDAVLRLVRIESPEHSETVTQEDCCGRSLVTQEDSCGRSLTAAEDDEDRLSECTTRDPSRFLDRVHSDTSVVEMSYAADRRFDSSGSSSGLSSSLLEFRTKPACLPSDSFHSLSVSDEGSPPPVEESVELQAFVAKMKSGVVSDQEEALVWFRSLTRENHDHARVRMCTREVLKCLGALMHSRCVGVQANAVASLVNLSLEKPNKVKIARSGLIPSLIDVLKGGHVEEAQEHAAGAVFSLALDDENKAALGVLGAVQPLVRLLDSDRTRLDAAMALYHLSLSRGNRVKLMRAGAMPKLMALARGDDWSLGTRAVLILSNIASSSEGRAAMLDANAITELVALMKESWKWEKPTRNRQHAEAIHEHCVLALCLLARDSWRFRGLAREAGAVDELAKVAEKGSDPARERAGKLMLTLMKGCGSGELVGLPGSRQKQLMAGTNSNEF